MKFIMLINVKMPTKVGILTFISMINTTSEGLKVGSVFIFQNFGVHDHLKFISQLSVEHDIFQRRGYLMLHDLARAATQVVNFVQL